MNSSDASRSRGITDSRARTPVEAAESLIPALRRQSKPWNHWFQRLDASRSILFGTIF